MDTLDKIIAKLNEMVDDCVEIMADAAEDDDEMYTIYQARKFGILDSINVIQLARTEV